MTRVTEIKQNIKFIQNISHTFMILVLSSDQLQILTDHVVQKGCLAILGGGHELGLDLHIIL